VELPPDYGRVLDAIERHAETRASS